MRSREKRPGCEKTCGNRIQATAPGRAARGRAARVPRPPDGPASGRTRAMPRRAAPRGAAPLFSFRARSTHAPIHPFRLPLVVKFQIPHGATIPPGAIPGTYGAEDHPEPVRPPRTSAAAEPGASCARGGEGGGDGGEWVGRAVRGAAFFARRGDGNDLARPNELPCRGETKPRWARMAELLRGSGTSSNVRSPLRKVRNTALSPHTRSNPQTPPRAPAPSALLVLPPLLLRSAPLRSSPPPGLSPLVLCGGPRIGFPRASPASSSSHAFGGSMLRANDPAEHAPRLSSL